MMHTGSNGRLGFNIHAFAFVVGIVVMIVINFYLGPPYWVIWPILGWGIGIIAHWFFVLGPGAGTKRL
jgi:hypothetical protein